MANLAQVLEQIEKHDTDYEIRYVLVWRAVALALSHGYAAGVRIDLAEPEWPVVYIELPTGQTSWHMPQHTVAWDGHDTDEKYRRTREFVAGLNRGDGVAAEDDVASVLTVADSRKVLDDPELECLVVMTGGCKYFTDGVHRCCVAPLSSIAIHGTTEHAHSCMCRTSWATVRSAGE